MLVGFFIYSGERIFGDKPSAFIPIIMLLLFVFSALLTGTLILGKPIFWYIEGKKKEAVSLLLYTIVVFLITILLILLVMFGIKA